MIPLCCGKGRENNNSINLKERIKKGELERKET